MIETGGPVGGSRPRPASDPDLKVVFPARPDGELFIEWSGSGHPLSDEIIMLVWFARVTEEPEAPLTVSPHPQGGYVVYVNDHAEYYEVWKTGELQEDGGWLTS